MKKTLIAFIAIIFVGYAASTSYALPRFALWRGEANCLGCHANPTGGGIRTAGGEAFASNVLSMWKRGDKFSGQISDGIRLGLDMRNQYLSFSTKLPQYTAVTDSQNRVTIVRGNDTTKKVSGSHAMSLAFEIDASLTSTLHAVARFDPLANKNEEFGLLHFVHSSGEIIQSDDIVNDAYIKIGSFLPSFGVRFDDHTMYVKGGNRGLSGFGAAGLFWTEGYSDVGVELGATFFDRLSIQVGTYNGSEETPGVPFPFGGQDRAVAINVSLSNEFIEDAFSAMIGYSRYMRPREENNNTVDVGLNGIYIGVRGGPITLLAEYDKGENIFQPGSGSYVASVTAIALEGSVNITKGLAGILRYETYKDESAAGVTGTEVKNRITIGAQWFPLRFLEVRPEFRMATVNAPAATSGIQRIDELTQNTILIQTHLYF